MFAVSVEFGPKLADIWPHLAELDRIRCDSGQIWPGLVQMLRRICAEFGHLRAEFDRRWTHLGRIWTVFGQVCADFGQFWRSLGQIWPESGRFRPSSARVGQMSARRGPNSTELASMLPNPGRIWPNSGLGFGQIRPELAESLAGVAQERWSLEPTRGSLEAKGCALPWLVF